MQQYRRSIVRESKPALKGAEIDDRAPLSRRILLMGIVLIPLMCIAVEYGEIVRRVDLVGTSLMILVTTILLFFIAFNVALKRWAPRWRFTQAELLFLFVMLTAAGNIAGTGMIQLCVPMLTTLQHFATPENRWGQFLPFMKDWMVPDKSVVEAFWRGQTTFYTPEHIKAWLGPLLIWALFAFAYICFTLCFNVLIRRQWVDRERLAFPIVYFPLELTREGPGSLLHQKLLWLGFAVAVALETLAGLHHLYPTVPYFPIKAWEPGLDIGHFFGAVPSTEINLLTMAFYPLALGLAYFVHLEVLFSLPFFYWFARLEEFICIWLGYRGPGVSSRMYEMPYLNQQSEGAFLALALAAIWAARKHLKAIIVAAFKGGSETDTRDFISYRTALIGLLASAAFIFVFWYMTGVELPVLILFFPIFFLTVVGYTLIRANAGLPFAFGPNHPPHLFLTQAYGPVNMSPQTIAALNYSTWLGWDWRGTTMPHQMEGLKIASSAKLNGRDMVRVIVLASGIAIIASFITLLALYYRFGGESGGLDTFRTQWTLETWDLARGYMESGANRNWWEINGGAAGALVLFWLGWMQKRLVWWPFHPIGYTVSLSITATYMWCPMLIVWIIKSLILRYGGMSVYRRGIPLAVGLILGDFTMAGIWALAGLAAGKTLYITFP